MLSPEELAAWYEQVNVSQQGRSVIDQVRSSDPARRVGGGRRNVSGRYPSRKMGVTIQFESHRVELAAVYEFEHDTDVFEYYDQPPSFKLEYLSSSGRRIGVVHTPDYFVIRQRTAGWEECKTEEDLQRLTEHNPNRYRLDPGGHWCCPPGEEHAKGLGLYYRVRSSREIDWTLQRNIQFLEDYFRCDSFAVSSGTCERVVALVTAVPGLPLESLFRATHDTVTRDEVYALVSEDKVYVDLHAAALAEPEKVRVFPSRDSQRMFIHGPSTSAGLPGSRVSCPLNVGCMLAWDGTAWKVINIGQTTISLLREDQIVTEVPLATLETLAKEGRVTWSPASEDGVGLEILKILSEASDRALRVANERLRLVREGAGDTAALRKEVAPRTLRRWNGRYREAEEAYRCGFLGLLPQTERRANATCKIPEATKALMQKFISEDYEASKQKSKFASWISLRLACERQGTTAPSYRTFCLAIGHRPPYDRALKRQGSRAAYAYESFQWYLEPTTPRHGDRPFEIAHIDHTQLDVELVCSETGHNLGRPWMTLVTDAFSRRILATYVTFDPPSYRSCMMVLRESVRRHARLPQIVVVDYGGEFESVYFETLLARYECTKKTRPPAAARFGSVCERIFGMATTRFVHNLRGNTQITRCVRQVTPAVDPKNLAVWTLPELCQRLTEFVYEVYDTLDHPSLGQSPRESYQRGLAATGQRVQRLVPYNREFLMLTLPAPRRGSVRVQVGQGVKVNYLYYW